MAAPFTPTPEMLAFPFDGERLALDFVGTLGDRADTQFERLRAPEDLARWIVAAGLGHEAPTVRPADLRAAVELREAIHRGVRAGMAGRAPSRRDVAIINATAAREPLAPQLVGGDGVRVSWRGSGRAGAALSTVARDAIELLGGGDIGRVRECAAEGCSLLFVDESHAQRRRWCSMARCGNRNKVSAYRRRRAAAS